jgi:hypothetical protein
MPMYSACGNAALPALGFPIRESTDHRLFSAYPWLIAAVHALHRLLVPRHPPCALHILTVITRSTGVEHAVIPVTLEKLCSFQGPRAQRLRRGHKQEAPARTEPPVSQNSTACEAPATRARACVFGSVDIARTRPLISLRYAARGGPGAPILETSLERR